MPAVLTMVSNGDFADGEIAQLQNICGFSPIFAAVYAAKLVAMIKAVLGYIIPRVPMLSQSLHRRS